MTKYEFLLNILDKIIDDAPTSMSKKYPKLECSNEQEILHARSRAFIHLYLKVSFGILDFNEREHFITDGTQDGGIDGYYICADSRTVYFIQSKFRANDNNFENKQIDLKEILIMDVDRVLEGEEDDEQGNPYNGKIKQLQRELSNTDNIARYSYEVIILANLFDVKKSELVKLSGGIFTSVFNYEKCYTDLVLPVISGTFYKALDLNINIDLSNKNAGSKISYTVQTRKGECEITVLFVPTLELGKIMYKYKNSILQYNPRSYLGHEGKKVNTAIRETITNKDTNEFALFNNGITMLSDETYINERIGQKNKAQLIVKNPQIINGGQTSYTLSRIYEEHKNTDAEKIFQNKEVLLKVITLLDNNYHSSKVELIKDISEATNQQTPVINADKLSNDDLQIKIQSFLFEKYGVLYERKRGEFADGIHNGYISQNDILERNLFFRMFYAANGNVTKARQKKLFINQNITFDELIQGDRLDNTFFGFLSYRSISKAKHPNQRVNLQEYAKIKAATTLLKPQNISEYQDVVDRHINVVINNWRGFINSYSFLPENTKVIVDRVTGRDKTVSCAKISSWYNSDEFNQYVIEYFTPLIQTNS